MSPSTVKAVAKNSALMIGNNLTVMALSFLTTLLIIRGLSVTEFGLLTLALSALTLMQLAIDFGIGSVIISDVSVELGKKNPGAVKSLLYRFAQMQVVLAGLWVAGLLLLAPVLGSVIPEVGQLLPLIPLMAVILVLFSIRNIFLVSFNAHSRFHYSTLMQSSESVARFVLIVFFLFAFKMRSLDIVIWAYVFSGILSLALTSVFFAKTVGYLKGIPRTKTGIFYKLMRGHGKYNIVTGQIRNLIMNLPYWIINALLGPASVAIFSTAIKFQSFFTIILESIGTVFVPLVSANIGVKERRLFIYQRATKYGIWLSLALLAVGAILVPFLIQFAFGQKYLDSIPIFWILILLVPFVGLNIAAQSFFFALKGQKTTAQNYAVGFFIVMACLAGLGWMFQLPGIAAGYVIGLAALVMLQKNSLKTQYGLDIRLKDLGSFDPYDRGILRKIIARAHHALSGKKSDAGGK